MWYQHFLNHKHQFGSKIIQRVGDVGTHSKPELTRLVIDSTKHSDHVIFPSYWAKNYINYEKNNFTVIENAPQEIFYKNRKKAFSDTGKIRIVTHHWSTNEKKGFDFYQFLGNEISNKNIQNVDFTFIGRFNEKYQTKGIDVLAPMTAEELATVLPSFDLYLTASLAEAGANHVLEAMASGLPVLYRQSGGSIDEYCKEFGKEYKTMQEMLEKITSLSISKLRISSYNRKIEKVINEYEKIIRS